MHTDIIVYLNQINNFSHHFSCFKQPNQDQITFLHKNKDNIFAYLSFDGIKKTSP